MPCACPLVCGGFAHKANPGSFSVIDRVEGLPERALRAPNLSSPLRGGNARAANIATAGAWFGRCLWQFEWHRGGRQRPTAGGSESGTRVGGSRDPRGADRLDGPLQISLVMETCQLCCRVNIGALKSRRVAADRAAAFQDPSTSSSKRQPRHRYI